MAWKGNTKLELKRGNVMLALVGDAERIEEGLEYEEKKSKGPTVIQS